MKNPLFDVVTFGEAMAMFIAEQSGPLDRVEHFTRRMAGAEANVAIGLSRLGMRAGWMSKIGNDPFGAYIARRMNEEKVDTNAVMIEEERATGFQLKGRADKGNDPVVQYFRKFTAASTMSVADFDSGYYLNTRHLHLTGIAPALSESAYALAEHLLAQAKAGGITVSFDPNLRPALWPDEAAMIEGVNRLAVQADWVLPGLQEGRLLTGCDEPPDIAAWYLSRGARIVCIKLGVEGAYCRTEDMEIKIPAYPVKHVVDTVGAGDGFAVGFVSAVLEGCSLEEAVRRGAAIGAVVVTSEGDSEGLPTRKQLEAFMSERGGHF